MVRATSLIVGLAVASATATTASAFVPTGAPSVGRVDPLHAKGAKRAAAKRILLAPFRKLGIGSDGGSKATAPPAFEVWSPARKVDFGTSESWGKAEVDAYVAKVKAEVDVIAKARLDASAGLSKEEVDAYIAKVKAKVDVVAKARPAPAEMQAAGEVALVAAAEGRATAKKPVGEKQVFTGADVAPVESEGLSTEEVDEFLAESLLSAGLSKEQVDEFVTKVKFEVDMVAAKRTVPEEVVAANPAPVIKDAETPAPAAPTPAVAAPAAPSSDAAARSEAAQKINAQYTAMEASTSVEASPSDAPDDVYVGDPEALLAAAEAAEAAGRYLDAAEGLVRFARIKTDGGCLRVKGKSDPPEYRKIWDEYAPRAAKLAEAHGDGSARSLALFVEASTMAASSKGLIRVATSGDLPKLEKAVDDLREIDETYDNGVAWIFAGSNYLALPWPIKSADKARVRFRKAQGISAESPRNLYFSALAAMEAGSTKQAAKLFQRSLDAPAVSTSDRDLEGFLREQAKAGLAKCP